VYRKSGSNQQPLLHVDDVHLAFLVNKVHDVAELQEERDDVTVALHAMIDEHDVALEVPEQSPEAKE